MIWLLPIINLVAVLVTMGTSIYWMITHRNRRNARKLMANLAYPEEELPLIGHPLLFRSLCKCSADVWIHSIRFLNYYEDGFYASLGHQIWLFSPDLHLFQELLASQDAVEKSYIYRTLNCITNGVFTAPAVRWRKLRKRVNLTFSVKMLDSYMDAVNDNVEIFSNVVIRKLIEQNSSVDDIQPHIARCFFDVMTRTHFGARTDEQVQNRYQVTDKTSEALELIIERRMLKPHLQPNFTFYFTEARKIINQIMKEPLEFINSFIEARMNYVESARANGHISKGVEDSVMYVEMVAETLKELNIPVTIQNIQENSADLLIAGSDTTSVAAATLLYQLALDKDIQEKVYEEVSHVYGGDSFRPLTRQEVASLTYLDMTVNEALRWSSPPGIMRELSKDHDIGKYVIPKGASVYMLMLTQHKSPVHFERPYEFYPKHFNSEAVKARPKMAFLPFSSGPRNCPGKLLAYVLLKSMAAVVVNNYILETDLPFKDVKRKIILMTQHMQGYPIRFIPRNHNRPRDKVSPIHTKTPNASTH